MEYNQEMLRNYDSNALNIYTDGSAFSSPRKGGVGIRFKFPDFLEKNGNEIRLPSID